MSLTRTRLLRRLFSSEPPAKASRPSAPKSATTVNAQEANPSAAAAAAAAAAASATASAAAASSKRRPMQSTAEYMAFLKRAQVASDPLVDPYAEARRKSAADGATPTSTQSRLGRVASVMPKFVAFAALCFLVSGEPDARSRTLARSPV